MGKDQDEGESTRGFKVADRRRFVNADVGEGTAAEPAPESSARDAEASVPHDLGRADADAAHEAEAAAFAEMTFSTFVMGLTTQALMHLGEIADPALQHPARDLPAAKQMIDLLGILREKTKGNLDSAEEQLLGSMLYDLRMRYVEVARAK